MGFQRDLVGAIEAERAITPQTPDGEVGDFFEYFFKKGDGIYNSACFDLLAPTMPEHEAPHLALLPRRLIELKRGLVAYDHLAPNAGVY